MPVTAQDVRIDDSEIVCRLRPLSRFSLEVGHRRTGWCIRFSAVFGRTSRRYQVKWHGRFKTREKAINDGIIDVQTFVVEQRGQTDDLGEKHLDAINNVVTELEKKLKAGE